MRIDDKNNPALSSNGIGTQKTAEISQQGAAGLAGSSRTGASSDQVALSLLAGRLTDLDLNSTVRQARVDELQAQYNSGRYAPDAGKVADAIVQDLLASGGADAK